MLTPEIYEAVRDDVEASRKETAFNLEAASDTDPEANEPLMTAIDSARQRRAQAETEIRRLIAYGREFARPPPVPAHGSGQRRGYVLLRGTHRLRRQRDRLGCLGHRPPAPPVAGAQRFLHPPRREIPWNCTPSNAPPTPVSKASPIARSWPCSVAPSAPTPRCWPQPELGGGRYNTTYRIDLAGQREPVVLRAASAPDRQFHSEPELMRNEYASVPWLAPIAPLMPRVLGADWSHETIGRDWMIQSILPGTPAPELLGSYPRETFPASVFSACKPSSGGFRATSSG